MKNTKRICEKGITLIALVITIIVLLILAGVSISMITGEEGILAKVSNAKEKHKEAEKIEQVRLAVVAALMNSSDYKTITIDNLEEELNKQFAENPPTVENKDGTFTVIFDEDDLCAYDIDENGNVTEGINWEYAKEIAVAAPTSQDEERNNGVIGIGTDGNPVDMDLWEYNLVDSNDKTKGYGLNDTTSLGTEASANASKGYLGEDYSNIIIPQYIKKDEEWIPVTNLDWTFYDCSTLEKIEKIPSTVKSMRYTFRKCIAFNYSDIILPYGLENMMCTFHTCTSLSKTPKIPNTVTNGRGAFSSCSSLISIINLPEDLVDMIGMFNGCKSLIEVPNIPSKVEIMERTFRDCTSLVQPPKTIPASVTNFIQAFYNCDNIEGTIEINANLNESITGYYEKEGNEEGIAYYWAFNHAVSVSGKKLKLTGSCPVLEEIVIHSNNSNITL